MGKGEMDVGVELSGVTETGNGIEQTTTTGTATAPRKITHIDMDAYFASVEQHDNQELIGKPVIVCESLGSRGVVSTASYEARKFGIHSAMPLWKARNLCPDGKYIEARIERYKEISEQIKNIFLDYTDLVEPVALDEAYLDVTVNKKNISSAMELAKEIKQRIYVETRLTASAGVSFNMFLAKTASGMNKPNGLTEITKEQADEFLVNLPIGDFYGVGEVTEGKFHKMGVNNGGDLKKMSLDELKKCFGKPGIGFYNLVRGIDERIVDPNVQRKSLGAEITLDNDTDDREEMLTVLVNLTCKLWDLMGKEKFSGRTVTLKVKYDDFTPVSRQKTLKEFVKDAVTIFLAAVEHLDKTEAGKRKVRLLGITVS